MNILKFKTPFPHLILEDVYTEEEQELMWNEIVFLEKKFLPPSETGAAIESIITIDDPSTSSKVKIQYGKRGYGIFLDDLFTRKNVSDIIKITQKLYNSKILTACKETDLILAQLYQLNYDTTVVNKYVDGDFYSPHTDLCIISIISVLHKTPKKYSGGELEFPEYNHTIDLNNNQALIFPSLIRHGVKEVNMESKNDLDGRFSITKLICVNPSPRKKI